MNASTLLPLLLSAAVAVAAPPATPAPNPHRTIVGIVVSVEPATRRVTVGESVKTGGEKGATIVLTVDGETKLLRGKRPATFEELKASDHVVARYVEARDGARALSIRIAEAP